MDALEPFINRKVVVLHRYDTIYQASRTMEDNNIGSVIVADQNGLVVGMVTDRDLACGLTSIDISQNSTLDAVMEKGLIWATEKDSLNDVINLMIENSIRRIPIVRHTTRGHVKCVGFVSLDDLICFGAISIDQASEIIKLQLFPRKKIIGTSSEVVTLRPDDNLYRASRALCDYNVGSIVIADYEETIQGLVTDRDIACTISSLEFSQGALLKDIMRSQLTLADQADSIENIIDLMIENSVRRIPIVKYSWEGQAKCVGFVSLDDLIAERAITISEAAKVIGPQVSPKTKRTLRHVKRSHTRIDQTEAEFSKRIAHETGLTSDDAREVTFCFLETLFRRISPGASNDLASQLPLRWKEYLSAFMTGPNRRVRVSELIHNIASVVNVSEETAKKLAVLIYRALSDLTAGNTMEHLVGQLPRDFQGLFKNSDNFKTSPRRSKEINQWF